MSEKSPAKNDQESNSASGTPDQSSEGASSSAEDAFSKALAAVAKSHAEIKADQESIGASKAEIEAIKAEAKTARESIATDLTSFTELKSRVTGLIKDTEKNAKQLSEEHESVGTQLNELKKSQKELKDFLESLNKIKSAAEANKDSVAATEKSVNQTKIRFDELATSAQASHSEMSVRQSEATTKADQIEELFNQTNHQYEVLFKDEKDENGNIKRQSVQTQIQDLYDNATKKLGETQKELGAIQDALTTLQGSTTKEMQRLQDEFKSNTAAMSGEIKAQFDNLHDQLKNRVESLLPGAGAAGLASTYFDAKSKYGFTPFKASDDEQYPKWARAAHYGTAIIVTLSFYIMFIAPLGGIVYIFSQIIASFAEHTDQLKDFNINIFALRLLITLPLGTISWFGWASIRLYRQMYEEYNYKQRVMQLYHSFKDEIGTSGLPEQKQALLTIMLDAVAAKPDFGAHDQGAKDLVKSIIDKIPSVSFGKKE